MKKKYNRIGKIFSFIIVIVLTIIQILLSLAIFSNWSYNFDTIISYLTFTLFSTIFCSFLLIFSWIFIIYQADNLASPFFMALSCVVTWLTAMIAGFFNRDYRIILADYWVIIMQILSPFLVFGLILLLGYTSSFGEPNYLSYYHKSDQNESSLDSKMNLAFSISFNNKN